MDWLRRYLLSNQQQHSSTRGQLQSGLLVRPSRGQHRLALWRFKLQVGDGSVERRVPQPNVEGAEPSIYVAY